MLPSHFSIYIYAGAATLIVVLSAAVKIQTTRLHTAQGEVVKVQAKFDVFKAETKRLGEAQNAQAAAQAASDKAKQEKANAENDKTRRDLAGVTDAYRKLRDQRAHSGSSFVSAAAPGAPSPERATFDRAALDRAISDFDRGVADLVEIGDKAIVDLDSAKRWAQEK